MMIDLDHPLAHHVEVYLRGRKQDLVTKVDTGRRMAWIYKRGPDGRVVFVDGKVALFKKRGPYKVKFLSVPDHLRHLVPG